MKYELVKYDISAERVIMQDIIEIIDDVETVTSTEPTDSYEVTITMEIHPTDNIALNFSRDITVTSHNNMTGYQVDNQREQAVTTFMESINE